MQQGRWVLAGVLVLGVAHGVRADDAAEVQALLDRAVLAPNQALTEVQDYLEARVPSLPPIYTVAEWEAYAKRLRADVLDRVVFRGEAKAWRDAPTKVEWLETIPGGPGYRIRKLRYKALPGVWIPALLYEPEKLDGKVPVVLNVNGHDGNGKAAPYKQVRCINLAKRGMLALNVEWFGMGQLRREGFAHGRMNQLDLCGTSGLAPFYLNLKRGLDVLLALEHADPDRVAVTGLSGGGWQTIFFSALDPRIKLTNPVAGYSGFRTRVRHHKDLGDSEQTPCDLATVADYTHLTALMAPRPTLLTFCAHDNCCFEAGYALPPLLDAAGPVFRLHGKEAALRSHVNYDPGTHNYEKDNREAHYRMLGEFFYTGDKGFEAKEIPSDKEVKTQEELHVELPDSNRDFNGLALALCKKLPRAAALLDTKGQAREWQAQRRAKLRAVVQAKDYDVKAVAVGRAEKDSIRTTFWRLRLGDAWTVPVVELARGEPKGTVLLLNDAGRRVESANVRHLLGEGKRVLAVDPFYFGESRFERRDYLWALLLSAVGDRPLGLEASEVAAVARWSLTEHHGGPVQVVATGPRTSLIALVAAGLEERAVAGIELYAALGSLKEVIEQNRSVEQMPEMFCFGLLEAFDVKQLVALAAPRPVKFVQPSERAKSELAGLKGWYGLLGQTLDPVN
jgi:dienelactone hydrolase